jgi:hypothetical protein
MTDPGSSMSLTATLVLTVVVLVSISGWLAVVFAAGREPRPGAGQGGGEPAGPGQLRS